MPHSFGYRAHTRTLFKKPFKTNGRPPTTVFLRQYKRGDYVDIKVNASEHKGMPFKHYHGRTGVVFNVNKRAVGVIINKEVTFVIKYFHRISFYFSFSGQRPNSSQATSCFYPSRATIKVSS